VLPPPLAVLLPLQVFRVMLQVTRSGCDLERQYGFVGHCWHHGDSYNVNWRALSQAWCR
jgi:hypothetical protein